MPMKLSKASKITSIFAVVGLIVTVITIYVQQSILSSYNHNLPFLRLSDNLQKEVVQINLTYNAILKGDNTKSFDHDVMGELNETIILVQAAYDGNPSALGAFSKETDEETLAMLKEVSIGMEKLAATTKARLDLLKQSQPGEKLDQQYFIEYENLLKSIGRLGTHVGASVTAEQSYLNSLSWVTSVLIFLCFGLLCLLIFRLQSSSDILIEDNTKRLNEETRRVGTLSQFIEAVSAGNYDIELNGESDDGNLTNTLITMRNKLKQNAEDDRKRNWATTGLAQVGEILRASGQSSTDLYDSIIKFVVKYTKSNQGGLFILNDDEEKNHFLELVACYAFERKKYLTRQIQIGDGLVGQCFMEGQRIYLLEVPQEYVSITSGLGGANPNALLIVPMKVNDKIYGVIELASFHKFEEYEIELVEKLAENIASTISNVRVNDTTRVLLEKTQQQAEEMKSQEEEIRQNMEELEATQEEMRRKQTILEQELAQSQRQGEILRVQEKKLTESQYTLQAIVDNIPRAIFWKDKDLNFMGCNKIFSDVAGAKHPKDLIGKSDFDMAWSAQAEAYRNDDLEVMRKRKAKLDIEEVNINSEGEESWVLTSKVPIIGEQGDVVAILGMFEDITARKRKEAEVAKKLIERDEALKELQALKHLLESKKV
jgi:PAS domain S-box-containing protein